MRSSLPIPIKPTDWRFPGDVFRDYVVGRRQKVKALFVQLRRALVCDLETAGYGRGEAKELVARFLIGDYRRGERAIQVLPAASPEAVRLLNLSHRLDLPEGWVPAPVLEKDHKIESSTLLRRLGVLRDALVGDVVAAGIDEEVAEHLIEMHLIGTRVSDTGWPSLALSPHGITLAEAAGCFVQRPRGRPPGSGRSGR